MTARPKRVALLAMALCCVVLDSPAWAASNVNQVLPYGEVNWDRGFIRVSAIGLPPIDHQAGAFARDQARQNAVSAAQRRLLGVILDLNMSDGNKLREHLTRHPALKERLRRIVTSAEIKGKTYSDGSVEVTMTLNTDGLKDLLEGP